MNDKEMIEEMAKVLCLFCKEMTEEKECERGKECYDWRLKEASFYYEQGYRKIPEGSVVLSKEEYEILTNQNKGLKEENHTLRLENNDLEAENQQLKKQLKELEEQRDRQAYIAEELIQEKHRWTEQARKETAKEFFTELFKQYSVFNDNDVIIAWQEKEMLKELAKKHGVEVEE